VPLECGASYLPESADEEDWESNEGQGESIYYSCEAVWDSDSDAGHPETHGIGSLRSSDCCVRYRRSMYLT
jgi:hypothetical protein